MMNKKTIICLYFIAQYAILLGQNSDFGIWSGLNCEYQFTKKTALNVNTCRRTFQNAGSTDLFYLEGGLSQKLFNGITVSGYYRYILKNENFSGYYSRHRLYCDVKYTYPVLRLKLSLRLRLQGQYNTYTEETTDAIPDYYTRLKATANYNWPSLPINPFISFEIFHPLNSYNKPFIDQKRITLGIQYKISKKYSIDLGYMYENDNFPRPSDSNIIAADFNISL